MIQVGPRESPGSLKVEEGSREESQMTICKRKMQKDATVLALRMEKGVVSQGMRAAST